MRMLAAITVLASATLFAAQTGPRPDWAAAEAELITHFQELVRIDTTDPPGGERPAVEYLKKVLSSAGIEFQEFSLEPHRPSLVARLKGNGHKRPLLIVGHTDTVNVDVSKWTFPPFSAARDGGYIYGRGTVDDKDNLSASLMVMLLLKRLNVPLERDVIFLAESGEEGTTRVGIQYMVDQHFDALDAEYCLAEGGNGSRVSGTVRFVSVQTLEKIPYAIELVARGSAGHGSIPLEDNAVAHVSAAVAAVAKWQPSVRLNETTSAYFKRLAEISPPAEAQRYRDALDPRKIEQVDAWFRKNEPRHASMLRTSASPNMVVAGYRINVIPSEAIATLDVRALPDENMPAFLDAVRKVVNDPNIEVRFGKRDTRPGGTEARIDSELFKALETAARTHYNAPTLPTMSTGATDMAYLRARGMQCYGVGPAMDVEDGPKGFGAHGDQERILESELTRFLRFYWSVTTTMAGAPSLALTVGAAAQQTATPTHAQHLNTTGKQVMGFDQDKTTHHFYLYEDGGAVDVSVKDKADKPNIDAIRSHLPHIAMMFGQGNFEAPMMVHDTKAVPGIEDLAKFKDQVKYSYVETPTGGRVDIVTTDKDALAAVHAFMKFQIKDHETSDDTAVRKRKG